MAHNKDDNPTANRPWFGPIPTGGDWNPAHGADPDVIDFHRYAGRRARAHRSLIGRHAHAPESHPLATNLTVANGSTPAPRCPSLTSTSATRIRTFRTPAATRTNAGARSQRPRRRSTPGRPTLPTAAMTLHPAPPLHRHDPANLASCCLPSAPLRGGSRVARTAPRQDAPLTFGPLSRPLPLRSCSSCHRSRTASCPGRSSPSASSP